MGEHGYCVKRRADCSFNRRNCINCQAYQKQKSVRIKLSYRLYGGNEVKKLEKFQISLAAARVNAGLTQDDVAREMKVGKQTVVSWEKGKTEPKTSQARMLSKLYNMPLEYIFFESKSN